MIFQLKIRWLLNWSHLVRKAVNMDVSKMLLTKLKDINDKEINDLFRYMNVGIVSSKWNSIMFRYSRTDSFFEIPCEMKVIRLYSMYLFRVNSLSKIFTLKEKVIDEIIEYLRDVFGFAEWKKYSGFVIFKFLHENGKGFSMAWSDQRVDIYYKNNIMNFSYSLNTYENRKRFLTKMVEMIRKGDG